MNTNSVDFFKDNPIKQANEKQALILAVWQIGNPGNIGQVIRLAHNVGAQKVLFVNDRLTFRNSKIKKTAGFSYDQMEWEFIAQKNFCQLLGGEYQLSILETCDGAENIFSQKLPDKTILLAGSESHGLPADIIAKSDVKVFIPMPGGCKSMNISHALSVAAFEWHRQKSNYSFE